MPIEFYCPGCGNLMRTPDETAGRKGRCPTCQLKVQIPANSVAATSSESAVPRSAISANPKGRGPEPLRFDCGSCGKTLSIAATNAGKQGKCPHCGELMSIPAKSPAASERWKGTPKQRSSSPRATSSTPVSTPQPALTRAGGEKIEFRCSTCQEVVRVGIAAAGKKGQCPRCKAVIQIPLQPTSASGSQPIPSNDPRSSRPRPATSRLTPLPRDEPSGLTPLERFNALSPLEPLGQTPLDDADSSGLGDDGFVGDSFGLTQVDDGNPFRTDTNLVSAPKPAPLLVARRKAGRTGTEIATMICGGCLIANAVAQIGLVTLAVFLQSSLLSTTDQLRGEGEGQATALGYFGVHAIAIVIGGIAMLAILAGGIQMMRFKVWGLCLAACILTMLPCNFNCFFIFGVPIGIWGIVMLSLGSVRSAFR